MNETTGDWERRLETEGAQALAELFVQMRERLRWTLGLRMDRRLVGRIDPSDVIQETYLEAANRLPECLAQNKLAPHLWVRFLALQQLLIHHRRHLGTQARDAGREFPIDNVRGPEVSSEGMALHILDSGTSPSQALEREDRKTRLLETLDQMDALDREVLALRHFEHMTNQEAAQILGIKPGAASQRYFRALKRLKDLLQPHSRDDTGGAHDESHRIKPSP